LLRVVEKCIRRGAYLYIEGQLDIRKWKAKNSPIESWTCETVVHGWSGRISVLDFGGDIASYHNRDLDDFEEPPTPLSIKRSMAKHDSAMVDDVDDSGLQRFLGEPDDHAPAERRAAGDDRRNA